MSTGEDALLIRAAEAGDAGLILRFIRGIAEYERLSGEVVNTESMVRDALFGERPAAEALLAFVGPEPAGFAVFFHNYSTFLAAAVSTWRTSSSSPAGAAGGSVARSSRAWPGSRSSAERGAWSGRFWTGTGMPSASTRVSAPAP